MPDNGKPKPDVRFCVEIPDPERAVFSDGVRYVKFTAAAMVLSHDPAEPGLWGCDSYCIETRGVRHLDGLEITAQADTGTLRKPGREWYVWSVHYRRDRMELQAAEDAVKVLRAIDRRMRKLGDELGPPATLAQFCVYAAGAITRERQPFQIRVDRPEHDFEGTGYRSVNATQLEYHISSRCTEIRKLLGIDPAE
jgi:hypothetical protein